MVSVPEINGYNIIYFNVGSKALRNYFNKEVEYQCNSLHCKSISELPTFKDFEVNHYCSGYFLVLLLLFCHQLKIDEHGDASFTRTHKGQT